ncbi:hypothetical protein AGMMS49574_05400 [Bacteroidia bacterium]|nr:hypothetical protein AGMMS49574_05400 [Bacteroidia bacterium]
MTHLISFIGDHPLSHHLFISAMVGRFDNIRVMQDVDIGKGFEYILGFGEETVQLNIREDISLAPCFWENSPFLDAIFFEKIVFVRCHFFVYSQCETINCKG